MTTLPIRTLVGAVLLLGSLALASDSEISEAEMCSLRAEARRTVDAPLLTEAEELRQLKREAHRWGIASALAGSAPTEAEELRQLRRLHHEFLLERERTSTAVAEGR